MTRARTNSIRSFEAGFRGSIKAAAPVQSNGDSWKSFLSSKELQVSENLIKSSQNATKLGDAGFWIAWGGAGGGILLGATTAGLAVALGGLVLAIYGCSKHYNAENKLKTLKDRAQNREGDEEVRLRRSQPKSQRPIH